MKKKRLTEKMGGGARIGLGGINSTGPFYARYKTKNLDKLRSFIKHSAKVLLY